MAKPQNPKQSVNLTVDSKLLAAAKERDMNISALLDITLRQELARRWAIDNAEAIRLNNERIEKEGLWCDGLRPW